MSRAPALVALLLLATTTTACQGELGATGATTTSTTTDEGPTEPAAPIAEEPVAPSGIEALSPSAARAYAAKLAPMIVRRGLSLDELERLEVGGGAVVLELLETWVAEDTLGEAARQLVSDRLATAGERDGIDFDLPGNLAAEVARADLPWSGILTSDTCYDDAGTEVACDTGAPYTAGVLTTRAYLVSRRSRFNLTRASTMMKFFLCEGYPNTSQPNVPRESLLPLFQARSADEQTDERAIGGFGNGDGCFQCHGQFAAHAQLFVKFDNSGLWVPDATGEQDPEGELGRSYGELMASHFTDPVQRAAEVTDMYGVPVDDAAGAARVMSGLDEFWTCQIRNVIAFVLGLEITVPIPDRVLDDILDAARELAPRPSFADLVVSIFTNVEVAEAVLVSIGEIAAEPDTDPLSSGDSP
jgi:hypothetical protein